MEIIKTKGKKISGGYMDTTRVRTIMSDRSRRVNVRGLMQLQWALMRSFLTGLKIRYRVHYQCNSLKRIEIGTAGVNIMKTPIIIQMIASTFRKP